MKIFDFLRVFEQKPVFSTQDIEKAFPGFDPKNLVRWQKKGVVQKLRNRWYALPGKIRQEEDLFLIANFIYSPSYISLESAFSLYGWIPEGVFLITSVTTLKTNTFKTPQGVFRYSNLRPSLYFGFRLAPHGKFKIRVAEPEKALLDYLFFHPEFAAPEDFIDARLNQAVLREMLNDEKLSRYLTIFDSQALNRRFGAFQQFLHD